MCSVSLMSYGIRATKLATLQTLTLRAQSSNRLSSAPFALVAKMTNLLVYRCISTIVLAMCSVSLRSYGIRATKLATLQTLTLRAQSSNRLSSAPFTLMAVMTLLLVYRCISTIVLAMCSVGLMSYGIGATKLATLETLTLRAQSSNRLSSAPFALVTKITLFLVYRCISNISTGYVLG